MFIDDSSKPIKIGRNDPCPCGSGKKYKKCCMKKNISTIKWMVNLGTAFGKRVIADNVPVLNSVVGAFDDIKEEKEKEELDKELAQINETTSTTLDCVSNINNLVPIFVQKPSLNKIYELANMLSSTIKDNKKYDIEIITNQNKKTLRITPKKDSIEVNVRLKVPTEKLEGLSSLEELIENKIKEGKSVIFTEDEIESFTYLDAEIRQFWDSHPRFRELKFMPQIEQIPFEFSFIVENTEIAYHNVKMGQIYKDENEATLVSTNLPFEILLRLRPDVQKLTIKLHVEFENNTILDLDKFWQFLSALNDGNKLVIKDSKRGTTFLETYEIPNFVIDTTMANFIRKLAMIDRVYYTGFTFPENVTNEDIRKINEIVFIIENKYMQITDAKSSFVSEELDKLITKYEEKGYFDNLNAKIPISYDLFGKKIDMGMGRVLFKKAFIRENIVQLKKEISRKKEIDITFITGDDEDARIIF